MLDELFNNMFPGGARPRGSLGSGVVIDGPGGLVVTNSHVVRAWMSATALPADRANMTNVKKRRTMVTNRYRTISCPNRLYIARKRSLGKIYKTQIIP
jgi:hypothetical protein